MSDMPSRLEDLTASARDLVDAGDLPGAHNRLRDALTFMDPKPAHATVAQAEAALLYAAVLARLDEPRSARGWAAYAHTACRRLFGDDDPRTLTAANTLAMVLFRTAGHAQAARLYRRLHESLARLEGPASPRALAAAADLATVLHARGECAAARELLGETVRAHDHELGPGHHTGIKMLARLGAMARDCGDFGQAHEHLAAARARCSDHLSPDDPLAAAVATLARAPANPDHPCGAEPAGAPLPQPALTEAGHAHAGHNQAGQFQAARAPAAHPEQAHPEAVPPGRHRRPRRGRWAFGAG